MVDDTDTDVKDKVVVPKVNDAPPVVNDKPITEMAHGNDGNYIEGLINNVGQAYEQAYPKLDPKKVEEATTKIRGYTAAKVGQEEKISRKSLEQDAMDSKEAHDQYLKTKNDPDAKPKDWNSDKEREKYIHSAFENFGQPATVFALLASAFTHQPMTTALNAGAAAMEAYKANDENAYEKSYDSWKNNTKLALDRHKFQQETYKDAMELWKTDQSAGEHRAKMAALAFNDKTMLAYIDAGFPLDKVAEYNGKRLEAFEKVSESLPKMYAFNDYMQNRKLSQKPESELTAPEKKAMLDYEYKQGPKKSVAEEAIYSEQKKRISEGGPPLTPTEKAKISRDSSAYGIASSEKKASIADREERLMLPKDQGGEGLSEDDAHRKSVQIEAGRQDMHSTISDEKGANGTSPLDIMGDQAAAGDASVFSGQGYGTQGAFNRNMIRQRAIERHPDMKGEDFARMSANYRAYAAGQAAEARTGGARAAQLAIADHVVRATIPLAIEASKDVSRTSWVAFNKALQTGRREFSDTKLKRLEITNIQLAEEWSKAMNPTGQMTDTNRDLALSALRTADGHDAYVAAVKSLKENVNRQIEGVAEARKEMPGGSISGPKKSTPESDPFGLRQ